MNDAGEPRAGYFKTRLVRGGPKAGVRLFYGPPRDPHTGEEMDRSWRWQAEVNGQREELDRVWPGCMREEIDKTEYNYLSRTQKHALSTDPYNPLASPKKAVDWETASPPLF